MSEITFIIPNRGGQYIEFVTSKINEFYPDEKCIVINQENNKPFMRGQLFNIAYNYVDTEYMCFVDNDMFFKEYIDLIGEYKKHNCQVFMPWLKRDQVEVAGNTYKVIEDGFADIVCKGGINFLSKEVFKKLNGFSNLYIGYGWEDRDFCERCDEGKFFRNENTVCHIKHTSRYDKKNIHIMLNRFVYDNATKEEHGGMDTTTYEEVYKEVLDGYINIGVTNIGTTNEKSKKYIDLHKQSNRREAYSLFYKIVIG